MLPDLLLLLQKGLSVCVISASLCSCLDGSKGIKIALPMNIYWTCHSSYIFIIHTCGLIFFPLPLPLNLAIIQQWSKGSQKGKWETHLTVSFSECWAPIYFYIDNKLLLHSFVFMDILFKHPCVRQFKAMKQFWGQQDKFDKITYEAINQMSVISLSTVYIFHSL